MEMESHLAKEADEVLSKEHRARQKELDDIEKAQFPVAATRYELVADEVTNTSEFNDCLFTTLDRLQKKSIATVLNVTLELRTQSVNLDPYFSLSIESRPQSENVTKALLPYRFL